MNREERATPPALPFLTMPSFIFGDDMSQRASFSKRIRKNFGKIKKIVDIPELIGMQRESFRRFLQIDVPPEKREEIGL